jgi:hypothetical protein
MLTHEARPVTPVSVSRSRRQYWHPGRQ